MKSLIILLLTLFLFPQNSVKDLPIWNPKQGVLIDKSKEGEAQFIAEQQKYYAMVEKGYENLSTSEKKFYDNFDETYETYWDVIGMGDSWYDGMEIESVWASSHLKSNYKTINYIPHNIHDLDYQTAWVEGVEGYGIGEKIKYSFSSQQPRITSIIVVNGYVKSEKAWRENSRVKQLKLYINGVPTALLNLEDTRNEQIFEVEPIGNADRENLEELRTKPNWTLTFEITEVYKGEKYADTAITEIYFDGIDMY